MNAKPILLVTLSILILAGAALSNLRPVAAAIVVGVNLDLNSTSQTDVVISTSANQVKSFRIGAIVNATSTNQISSVYGWQFEIDYNASAFVPQGDPSLASLSPDGPANTVLFGAQTTIGTANWAGLINANDAFGSFSISSSGSVGQILVFLTLIQPTPAVTISAKTLLANVQFEFLNQPSTPQQFAVTNVLFTDSASKIIPGIASGFGGNETITNAPPIARFTHTRVSPFTIHFNATSSSDSDGTITNATGYFWDFGDGTQDLGVTGKVLDHTYNVLDQYNVTLRVVDDLGATGAARDASDNVIVNLQPSHTFATINLLPFTMRANTMSSPYQPGGTTGVSIIFTSIGDFVGNINVTAAISPSINGASPPTTTPSTVELKRVTSTTVTCPAFILVNSMTTCTATVADDSPGTASTPTLTVSFTQSGVTGSFTGNPCTLSGGRCSVTFSASTTGIANITGTYNGDALHGGSSNSVTVGVRHPTSTTLSCGPPSVSLNTNTTCIASVTDTFSTPTPMTGSISFLNTTGFGFFNATSPTKTTTCSLQGTGTTKSCAVTYEPTILGTGTHTINATYTGDATHSTSFASFDLTVTMPATATPLLNAPVGVAGSSITTDIATPALDILVEGSNSSLVTVTFPLTTPLLNYTLTVTAMTGTLSRSIQITLLPTTMRIDPSLVKDVVKGATFTASVAASVAGAISWQFTLHYDPALLSTSFRKVSFGPFWQDAISANLAFPVIVLNQTSGTLIIGATLLEQGTLPLSPFTGNATLASVIFTVNSYDNSSLHLDTGSIFTDVNSHPIPVSAQSDGLFDNRLPHDVAVTSVSVLPTTVPAGGSVGVTVVVKNKGLNAETTSVAVTGGGTSIGQQQVSINPGELKTLSFTWVTPSSTSGTISIQAQATVSTGDGDGSDNTLSTTLKVNAQPVVHTSNPTSPYLLYGGVGAAAAIIAIAAFLFIRRRRTPSLAV